MGLWTKLLRKNRNKPVVELRPLPKLGLEWSPGFVIKDEMNEIPVTMKKEEHDRLCKLHDKYDWSRVNLIFKSDIQFPNFTKIDWELMKEEPWSGNHNNRLDRHRNDAVDTLCYLIHNEYNSNDFIKDEWIKANPNAFKTKKWEEFKNMSKKEIRIRNVGFKKNVMVSVDVRTNLASIDADKLHKLYKERDIAVDDNDQLLEENEKLRSKIISLRILTNSVYGLPKPCNYVLCCGRHHGESAANAFAKAAESLAKHIKAGKPTYDQLLKENEKLRKECEEFRAGNEEYKERNIALRDDVDSVRNANVRLNKEKVSLQAEIDELDKECDALVDEKEKLQAELTNANEALKNELEYIKKLRLAELKEYHKQLDDLRDSRDQYMELYHSVMNSYLKIK